MKREDKIKSTVNDLDSMGLCDRDEGRVCAKEGEGVPIVKGGKGRGKRVC